MEILKLNSLPEILIDNNNQYNQLFILKLNIHYSSHFYFVIIYELRTHSFPLSRYVEQHETEIEILRNTHMICCWNNNDTFSLSIMKHHSYRFCKWKSIVKKWCNQIFEINHFLTFRNIKWNFIWHISVCQFCETTIFIYSDSGTCTLIQSSISIWLNSFLSFL